ncbi:MAG: MFS transporter [Melioribacteraceae bacterium]|nr:MFS transporter [Melioribacteraceae bacterium]
MNNKSVISRFPFFYGYIIIAGGTIGVLLSAPGQTVGISVFTDFLIRDLGISRESLSFAYLVGTMLSSFLLTYAGKFYDKFGARITAMSAGFFLGISLVYMSFLTSITSFIKTFFDSTINELLVFVLISIGFFFVRFFGQGTLTMASKNMVMKWFEKRRGMASAIMGIAISFGFSYSPKLFDDMIVNFGWENTWLIIGVFVATVFVLFTFFTFRDNPEEFGLTPDGNLSAGKKNKSIKYKPNKDYTLSEARVTFNFWIFNLTLSLQALYITALTFNIVDIFTKADLSREDAILIFLPVSVIAVIFQLVGGYLADFIRLKYLLMVQLSGMLISMFALIFLSGGLPLYLIILGLGIASGLFGVISVVCWPRFYGTKYLGEISGFSMGWVVAGSALGPYMFSLLLEFSGDYSSAGIVMSLICVTLLILSFRIKNKNLTSEI